MAVEHKLTREQKIKLSELLAAGHRYFGKVAPRRPYAKDYEGGDGGSASLLLGHPLFMEMPIGASSDLTFLANENSHATEEIEKRSDELNPALRKSLENKLGHALAYQPPKTPTARPL